MITVSYYWHLARTNAVAVMVVLSLAALMLGLTLRTSKADEPISGRIQGFRFVEVEGGGSRPVAFVMLSDGRTIVVGLPNGSGCIAGSTIMLIETYVVFGSRFRVAPSSCTLPS